jgi:hypothetical protein
MSVLAPALGLLSACSSTQVVRTDGGGYQADTRRVAGDGNAGEQRAIAIRKASDYCNAKGLKMQLEDRHPADPGPNDAPEAQVPFKCVAP